MTGREQRRLAGYARDAIQILEHSRALYAQGQVYFTAWQPCNCGYCCAIPSAGMEK